MVERILGKAEVVSSILTGSTTFRHRRLPRRAFHPVAADLAQLVQVAVAGMVGALSRGRIRVAAPDAA